MRYFSWLIAGRRRWDSAPGVARAHCMLFLNEVLYCRVCEHRGGFAAVDATVANAAQIRLFLAAGRAFYSFAIHAGLYTWSHPLERLRESISETGNPDLLDNYPCMPQASGVAAQARAPHGRHTAAYFVLVNEQWMPQIIDDPSLPRRLLDAGQQAGWHLREQLVTRLLFETGARISEICGLTLGDWYSRGLRCEVSAFSKGSGLRRVKILHFSDTTAKLLRRYFDQDRRALDECNWRLADYLRCSDPASWYSIPWLLTAQRTALSARTFRDLAWRPACCRAGIIANIHQARHWYVTQAMREIYDTLPAGTDRERAIDALIAYMKWRSGRVTLERYDHHFRQLEHADLQAKLHARLDRSLRTHRTVEMPRPAPLPGVTAVMVIPSSPDWQLLQRLGRVSRET
jgi:integrase